MNSAPSAAEYRSVELRTLEAHCFTGLCEAEPCIAEHPFRRPVRLEYVTQIRVDASGEICTSHRLGRIVNVSTPGISGFVVFRRL